MRLFIFYQQFINRFFFYKKERHFQIDLIFSIFISIWRKWK
jgi:hypothetical protein